MARTTKRGTCELCGASANVGMNHGAKVCPQCTHVQSALNKRIESVAAAARSMGKTEELLGHLIPAGGGVAVKMTANFLQEISGIVGYEGESPAELVEAVRKRVLTCASCDCEDVLCEIREIVEYVPEQGDKGLADAVRAFADRRLAGVPDCAECDAANALLEIAELVGKRGASSGLVVEAAQELVERAATLSETGDFLRGELLRACGLEMDDTEDGEGWDLAAAVAIQTIAELTNRRDHLLALLTKERADNARLYEEKINRANAAFLHTVGELKDEIARLNDLSTGDRDALNALLAKLTLAQQARDEWEQRAVQAESNVETLEAELRNREDAPAACASTTYLLDIALKALRGEVPDADQLAVLIDAARRAA